MQPQTPQRLRSRNLEELTCASVLAQLRSEGCCVEHPRRPIPGTSRSPDFVVDIDGEPVAIEVVRFLPPAGVGRAAARLRSIDRALKDRLQADALARGVKIVLDVGYAAGPLQDYPRPQVSADADLLASEIRRLLRTAPRNPSTGLALASPLPWLLSADLGIWPDSHPSFLIGLSYCPDDLPVAAEFVEATISRKGDQHLALASKAILAIAGMFRDVDELKDAFRASSSPVPLWRVYLVVGGGDAALVFEQANRQSQH
jgi:hypothetical protein